MFKIRKRNLNLAKITNDEVDLTEENNNISQKQIARAKKIFGHNPLDRPQPSSINDRLNANKHRVMNLQEHLDAIDGDQFGENPEEDTFVYDPNQQKQTS